MVYPHESASKRGPQTGERYRSGVERRPWRDPSRALHSFRPDNPYAALGAAVSYLMTKKAFAKQPFGVWSRVLVGQVNRKHVLFVAEGSRIVAFAGWAITTKEHAENWVEDRADIPPGAADRGEMFVFNAWAADDIAAHRFLLDEMRPYVAHCELIYYKRYYDDGRVRPARLTVNQFVERHVGRRRSTEN